ncbi:hypothetical protein [Peristeroidobacter soli]|uniref:hypothetical protein n=1 Tax=Peristeroidobacter soli TaxID=2497877 RepID=UPI00101CBC91|nr:hypothetical protein [Peristeroidobacter soli]
MAESAIRAERADRATNVLLAEGTLARAEGNAEWVRSEAALWPWVGRFFWSPALDLHPTRRQSLLPGWPEDVWSDERALAHVSRYLLSAHGLLENTVTSVGAVVRDGGDSEFMLALLPQSPLARLARRIGLVLHGAAACESLTALDEDERLFLTQRVPLYWHVRVVAGDDPDATGWHVLRLLLKGQPGDVRRRFLWKTPLEPGQPAKSLPGAALLHGLVRKILKEFESPWSSLFATLRRPASQIHLRG